MGYYRLRVNTGEFNADDIQVSLRKEANGSAQVTLSVAMSSRVNGINKASHSETSSDYIKHHEIKASTCKQLDLSSMRHYTTASENRPAQLVVEFVRIDESEDVDVAIAMMDSYDRLVEEAAHSLMNMQSIDDLALIHPSIEKLIAASFINGTKSHNGDDSQQQQQQQQFTPVSIVDQADGKLVRVSVNVPATIEGVDNCSNSSSKSKTTSKPNILQVYVDKSNTLLVKAAIVNRDSPNATSTYTKQLQLPKGTRADGLVCRLNVDQHVLIVEAPYSL